MIIVWRIKAEDHVDETLAANLRTNTNFNFGWSFYVCELLLLTRSVSVVPLFVTYSTVRLDAHCCAIKLFHIGGHFLDVGVKIIH